LDPSIATQRGSRPHDDGKRRENPAGSPFVKTKERKAAALDLGHYDASDQISRNHEEHVNTKEAGWRDAVT
jgi:hypothetical protein